VSFVIGFREINKMEKNHSYRLNSAMLESLTKLCTSRFMLCNGIKKHQVILNSDNASEFHV